VYGGTASDFEGSGRAPAGSNTTSDSRNATFAAHLQFRRGPTAPVLPVPDLSGPALAELRARGLTFPVPAVEGVRLHDTFNDPRSGGARVHRALDILAPHQAAVVAVATSRTSLSSSRCSHANRTMSSFLPSCAINASVNGLVAAMHQG